MKGTRWLTTTALAVAIGASLVGCASSSAQRDSSKIQIEASLYPLQWLSEQVGGSNVEVRSLARPGVEPHHLELAPKEFARVHDADLLVMIKGFQPAIDDAVAGMDNKVFDAATFNHVTIVDDTQNDHDHDHDDHDGGHSEASHDGHDHGSVDPHLWLDPTVFSDVAVGLADRLAEMDPSNADAYRSRGAKVVQLLASIDDNYREALGACESRYLVTSHSAFGSLARRYNFQQIGIARSAAEMEPSPSHLAEIAEMVADKDVRTIYVEPLGSEGLTRTVAKETGAAIAVLDPIETITDDSAAEDYGALMAVNLETLVEGQRCK